MMSHNTAPPINSAGEYRQAIRDLIHTTDPRRFVELQADIEQANLMFEDVGIDWYAIAREESQQSEDRDHEQRPHFQ